MSAAAKPETPKEAARRLASGAMRDGYKPIALHRYNLADGSPWCWRIRCKHPNGDKWIRPMRFNGTGFEIGEPTTPENGKPLYVPPYPLIEADPVVVVEGEPCADALARLGFVAMTSGAADSAKAADWASLRGRFVLLWPDNDDAGTKYADAVATRLRGLGCTVDVIDVAALGLSDKGDCVDWLALRPDATGADILALPRKGADVPGAVPDRSGSLGTADVIETALAALATDPGALYEPAVLAALRDVKERDAARFARIRHTARESKVLSMPEFDRQTSNVAAASSAMFVDVDPWAEPVDGAKLLSDITGALQRYVIADVATIHAVALWAVQTWLADVTSVAPIANVSAPEKRCGKSILLTALGKLSYRPLQVSNIAPAALFRAIEAWAPTLLIDEVDTFLREHEEARGILNSGFTRDSAFVIRCVGDMHEPTRFATWGPKALCGIGKIADTLEDRSIPLRLRRKTAGEGVSNLRHADPTEWQELGARIARWTDDRRHAIAGAKPAPIEGLHDRANDCWEPLLAVADEAGGDWPKLARQAAIVLHGLDADSPTIGMELLDDIRDAFGDRDRMLTAELLIALTSDAESPWPTWNKGRPITARQVAKRLEEFGIRPTTIRAGTIGKGYHLASFADAFARYLSDGTSRPSVTPLQTSCGAGPSDFPSVTALPYVTDRKSGKANSGAGCNGVTDREPVLRKAAEGFDI